MIVEATQNSAATPSLVGLARELSDHIFSFVEEDDATTTIKVTETCIYPAESTDNVTLATLCRTCKQLYFEVKDRHV